MIISARLKEIASFVSPFLNIVDIGTDHCYVPIFLANNNSLTHAIATDVTEGPIKEARKNIERHGLSTIIETRVGYGLDIIHSDDNIDCIIIAGMGGRLITEILSKGKSKLTNNKRLILQANVDIDMIRSYLCENLYEIVNEKILAEEGKFYEIIVGERVLSPKLLNEEEIQFGPVLLKEKSPVFLKKWEKELKTKMDNYQLVPQNNEKKQLLLSEIELIKRILS